MASFLPLHQSQFGPQNITNRHWGSRHVMVLIQLIFFSSESCHMSSPTVRKSIKHYSYHLAHTIGEGFSSQVFRGFDEQTNTPVAIKVVSKLGHSSSERLQLAQAEIRALGLLRGRDNILELREALQTKSSVYIVTELCSGGTLRDLMTRQRRLPEATAVGLMRQVIQGYRSIYEQGLVHRDIKPDNIFLTAEGDVRIGDFGFAINVQECVQPVRENLGSPLFMSLEALESSSYSFKSDIWAIGMTFFEILMGRVPWRSKTEKELLSQIQHFEIELFLPQNMSSSCKAFLRRTLERDVDDRMSPEELFAFQFQEQHEMRPSLQSTLKKITSLEHIMPKASVREAVPKGEWDGSSACMRESESTKEHSKPKLSQFEDETEKAITEKMTTSLPLQSTALPSKLSRKYSHVEKDETILPLTQQSLPSGKMERETMLMIQSQINYFRFVFKLFKRIHDTIKTTDEHISILKQNLLFLVHNKIEEIRTLQYLPVDANTRQLLRETTEYAKIKEVLGQYQQRYRREETRTGVRGSCAGEEELVGQMCFALKVLSQNILRLQAKEEEFQRKKGLVFIVQDLVTLSHLYLIERKHDWTVFHHQAGIQKALERSPLTSDARSHWQHLKEEVKKIVDF